VQQRIGAEKEALDFSSTRAGMKYLVMRALDSLVQNCRRLDVILVPDATAQRVTSMGQLNSSIGRTGSRPGMT